MWHIFTRELNYYIKNVKELIVISFLFISITLLVPFTFTAENGVPEGVGITILWVAMLCAIQLGSSHSWGRHAQSGELEQYQLLPWLLEWTVLGKMLAFFAVVMLQITLLLPLASLWLGIEPIEWPRLMCGLAAGGLGLVALNQLAAGLMAGTRKGAVSVGAIALPFSIPILIFGAAYCRQSAIAHETLGFLLGYAVFMLPVAAIAVAANIRAGN